MIYLEPKSRDDMIPLGNAHGDLTAVVGCGGGRGSRRSRHQESLGGTTAAIFLVLDMSVLPAARRLASCGDPRREQRPRLLARVREADQRGIVWGGVVSYGVSVTP